jgi:hypothetical protein
MAPPSGGVHQEPGAPGHRLHGPLGLRRVYEWVEKYFAKESQGTDNQQEFQKFIKVPPFWGPKNF